MAVVLGVDRCAGQWLGVLLVGGSAPHGLLTTGIAELVDLAAALAGQPPAVVAIDIPIGLPETGRRAADGLARALVGRRASSVFPVPVRAAVEEPEHARATALNLAATGFGISRQSHALSVAILDVDAWVRRPGGPGMTVVEVHPEVCFAALAGGPLAYDKKHWSGVEQRRRLLADAGIDLPAGLGAAGTRGAPDDVLDAAVAAWTARRVLAGTARSLPDPPERTPDGLDAAIWV